MHVTQHNPPSRAILPIAGLAILMAAALLPQHAIAQLTTTTVQGTIYRADGTAAGGTLLVSWPAFTTAQNQAVAAGTLNTTLSASGFVTLQLAPNAAAIPSGSYYTAVYHLSDGTVNTEYWVVPAAATASIAAVRAQLEPATVALQAASQSWVNNAIAASSLPLTGGVLTGNLQVQGSLAAPTSLSSSNNVINPKAAPYNAWGDGVHDDTAAINNALAAAQAAGAVLHFPAGTYLTSTGLAVSTTAANCADIEGDGRNNTILRLTAPAPAVYDRNGGTDQPDCHIANILFDANSKGACLIKSGQPREKIENLTCVNAAPAAPNNAAVILGATSGTGAQNDDFETRVENLQVQAGGNGASAPYAMVLNPTASDGVYSDIVLWSSPGLGTSAGLYNGAAANVFMKLHCYPGGGAPTPTCAWDAHGRSIYYATEIDGMTGPGIVFAGNYSQAIATLFTYGPVSWSYASSVGFSQTGYGNAVFGATCEIQNPGASPVPNWTLAQSGSNPLSAYGVTACNVYNEPQFGLNQQLQSPFLYGGFTAENSYSDWQHQGIFGYDAGSGGWYLQATDSGVANEPLYLNPNGSMTQATVHVGPGGLAVDASQPMLNGTTAGAVIYSEPQQGAAFKQALLDLTGYENTTATVQTITLPVRFSTAAYVTTDGGSCSGVTIAGATVTLPSSMSAPQTGLCEIRGW